jgi:hypothetical protein
MRATDPIMDIVEFVDIDVAVTAISVCPIKITGAVRIQFGKISQDSDNLSPR